VSYIPTSASISKSVIISSSSPILTSWLYALYGSAVNIIFAALNLILNCPSFKLTIAIHRGLPTGRPLPYVPYNPYIPIYKLCKVWKCMNDLIVNVALKALYIHEEGRSNGVIDS